MARAGGSRAKRAKPQIDWQVQRPVRQSRLGDQLYEKILDQIVTGVLPEGGKLPSESQLCDLFGVSRPVVREALSRLQADGVVVSRHGSGSFVQRRPSQAISLLTPLGDVADLMRCMEYRTALEGEAAYFAAHRRSSADLERMAKALQELDKVIARGEVGAEADRTFHMAIAAAAQNRYFVHNMEAIVDQTIRGMDLARKLSLRRNARRLALVQEEHFQIYHAIEAEDAEGARSAMRTHITNARHRILTDSTEP